MKNIEDIIKEHSNVIAFILFINILIIAFVVSGIGYFIFSNRGDIFDYFASEYIREMREEQARISGIIENNTEEESLALFTEESTIVDIVERASPAVVSIVATKDIPVIEEYYENYSPFGDDNFVFRIPRQRELGTEKKEVGGGTGFFISSNGLIVTNRHVVNDTSASYSVFTNSGEQFSAEVVAKDSFFDIAVIKIKGSNFSYLSFGDSEKLKVGRTVIAIGNALGEFRNTVSVGVISGLSRSIVAGDPSGSSELLDEVIQTDAAINPGNSGGPLLDLKGRVIGINVAVVLSSENIGFSIPSNLVKTVVDSVKQYGEIRRPFLGIRYVTITEQIKEINNLSIDYGVLIVGGESSNEPAIVPGSPADNVGLVENDIIIEMDGIKLKEKTLASVIRRKNVGDKVSLKILRNGQEINLNVTLGQMPE